jgi:hypothetical protein
MAMELSGGIITAMRTAALELSRPISRDYALPMKVSLLIAAAVTAATGCPATASALPPPPYMDHDGTYLVGTDIPPGLYMSGGASGSGMCRWSRLSSTGSGVASNIIDHGESSDAQYVAIAATDKAFESQGCQSWTHTARRATPISPAPRICIYPLTGCHDPHQDP